jgi:hypothetical protein
MRTTRSAKVVAGEVVVSFALAFALIGCAAAPSTPAHVSASSTTAASAPPPDVHDCALISQGKYQCGDKTYTSYDLTRLQQQHAAAQQNAAH